MAVGIPIVPQLAGETNYPAGGNPWNGTPIKVAPGVDYSTPNTKPPAQSFNYWLNLLSAQALANQNLAVAGAVANFDNVIADTSIDGSATALPVFWSQPWTQRWYAAVTVSANFKTYWTHDNGRTWTVELSETSWAVNAACSAPLSASSVNYVVIVNQSGATAAYNQAGTLTSISGTEVTLPAVVFPQGAGLAFLGMTLSGSTYTGLYYTGNLLGTSWTLATSTLPSAWQTGTCHLNGLVSCQSTAATDVSGPRTLVAMCGVTPGTDVGRLLVVASGGTFTDSSPSFLSGRIVTGVAYGANDNLWGVLCNDGTLSYLYTSPDLVTWTLVHEFANLPKSGGLAVLGYVWAAQVGTSTDNRVMYSGEVGALGASSNWGTSNAFLTGGLTASATPGSLQSSGFGLVGWSSTKVHFSKQVALMPSGEF